MPLTSITLEAKEEEEYDVGILWMAHYAHYLKVVLYIDDLENSDRFRLFNRFRGLFMAFSEIGNLFFPRNIIICLCLHPKKCAFD